MNHLVMFFLSILAFACLALSMERHQADFFGRRLRADHGKVLWIAGWTMLCAVFATLASAAPRVGSSSRGLRLRGRSK